MVDVNVGQAKIYLWTSFFRLGCFIVEIQEQSSLLRDNMSGNMSAKCILEMFPSSVPLEDEVLDVAFFDSPEGSQEEK